MLQVGASEIGVLLVLGLLLVGPDRIPGVAREVGRGYRRLRTGFDGMSAQLRDEVGLDAADLRDLDPRRLLRDDVTQSTGTADANPTDSARTHPPQP